MSTLRLSSFVLACLLLASSGLVHGQGFQIDRFYRPDGKAVNVYNARQVLGDTFLQQFNSRRGQIETAVRNQLGGGNLIGPGVTLYEVNVRLGQPTMRFISANQMEVTIRGNYMYAKSTTPTDLGSWADPAFELNFDIRFVATFSLPTLADPRIVVTSAAVDVPWCQLTARNVSGGIVTTVAVVSNFFIKTFTGRNLIQSKIAPYLTYNVRDLMNARLATINIILANLAREGYGPQIEQVSDQLIKIVMQKNKAKKVVKAKAPAGNVQPKAPAGNVQPGPISTSTHISRIRVRQAPQATGATEMQSTTSRSAPEVIKLQRVQPAPRPTGPILK